MNINIKFKKYEVNNGDWGLGIGPNPQSPIPKSTIPNPQSPFNIFSYL